MKASRWLVWAAAATVLLVVGCIGVGPTAKRTSPFAKAQVTPLATADAAGTPTESPSPDDAAPSPAPDVSPITSPTPPVSPTSSSPQVPPSLFSTPAFGAVVPTPTPFGGLPPIAGLPPTNTPTPLGARPITPVPIGTEPPKLPGTPVVPTPTFTPVTVVNVPPTPRPAAPPVPPPPTNTPPPASVVIPAPTPGPAGQPPGPAGQPPVAGVTVTTRGTAQEFTYPAVDIVAVPPTPTPFPTETPVPTVTPTWTPTWTPQPTNTPRPTYTPAGAGQVQAQATAAPFPTQTPYPTVTPIPVNYATSGTGDQSRGPYFLNQGAVLYIVAIQPQQIVTGTQSSFLTGPFSINLKKQDGSFVNSVGGSVSGTQIFTSTMVTSAPSSDQFRVDVDVPNQEPWQLSIKQPP